jgi:hypothetical protein
MVIIDPEELEGRIKVIPFWNPIKDKMQYCLIEDYSFWYERKEHMIPSGFVTDFASVPGFLWSFFKPQGKHNEADLEHDYLYDNRITTRFRVDKFFYQRMIECGVNKINAKLRYWAVRFGGKEWWEN